MTGLAGLRTGHGNLLAGPKGLRKEMRLLMADELSVSLLGMHSQDMIMLQKLSDTSEHERIHTLGAELQKRQ